MPRPSAAHLRLLNGPHPEEDPLSFDAVFRAHASYVASLALKVLGRDAEVDDVVQDVFGHAVDGLEQVRDPERVRPWLGTVTLRVARRKLRKRKLTSLFGLLPPPEYDAQLADPAASPESRAALVQLYEALDTLPVQERMAWVLRHIEGERLEAVAELCGCSLATAKRRLAVARTMLEVRLGR